MLTIRTFNKNRLIPHQNTIIINLEKLINIEQEMALYLKKIEHKEQAKIIYYDRLNVAADIGNNVPPRLTYWQI